MPTLAHRIALVPTPEQAAYFVRAAGTARFTWNWGLAEWNRSYEDGERPSGPALKKRFNQSKYALHPWLRDVHRDAHAQPFAHLQKAWRRFFSQVRAGARPAPECPRERRRLRAAGVVLAYRPRFKKKGRSRDSFYVANDQLSLDEGRIRLPLVGWVPMRESLRFPGKVLGATVSRTADRWFVCIQVQVSDQDAYRPRTGDGVVGVDLGLTAAATLSTGEKVHAPRPLKGALRRLQIRQRRVSRKAEAAKAAAGFKPGVPLPKGARLPVSENQKKAAKRVARIHARIANLRADFLHKTTTRLCRENQAVVIEDLNVSGMLKNHRLARAISDVGFGEFRRQMSYKMPLFGSRLVTADRWFPSSKLCSACSTKNESLTLTDRVWTCGACGTPHERDHNAALNLERLATEPGHPSAHSSTALPVASLPATVGTDQSLRSGSGGKVTPVRHEHRLEGDSGQEMENVHLCTLS
jgi:putative transposase